jgi:protein O-mannosyl-transferase
VVRGDLVSNRAAKAKRKTERPPPLAASAAASVAFQLDALWIAALIFGAVLVAYFPAIHGKLLWDDDAHVTAANLRSLHGLWRIWFDLGATQQYYPLLHSAFWIEHKLWGDAVVGYHLANILLHASAACLLLLILRRLKIPGASLSAAIFALHPIYVESVAWITEQKNTLSGVFYLGAMLAYLRFDQERRKPLYIVASALFILGLLTKTVTATLPAALLVIFWWQRGRLSWRRDVAPLLPWFALGAAAGLFTAWAERTLIGAEGAAFELSLLERCLLAGRVIWFYLGKLFWPVNLLFIYPRWEVNPAVWWQYLFPLGAAALVGALWLIRRRTGAPLAALLFFIGSLFPVLGFFNVYPFLFSFVADHFQYLAGIGIIVAASAGGAALVARVAPPARRAGQALGILLLAALTILTWHQSRIYNDPETLYLATLERNPGCWMCRNNLGILLAHTGRRQAAIELYEQALRIKPDYSEAHNNLGNALLQAGLTSEAMARYEQALKFKPNYAIAHNNRGRVLLLTGKLTEATEAFETAVRVKPDYAEAHYNLGLTLFQAGRIEEAAGHYKEALKFKPDYPDAHNNLGNILFLTGKPSEAKKEFEAALSIKPDYAPARQNLSMLRSQQLKTDPLKGAP